MAVDLRLECVKCGSDQFEYPDDPEPDDLVTCAGCGATAAHRDLQRQGEEQASELVDKEFRKIVDRWNRRR